MTLVFALLLAAITVTTPARAADGLIVKPSQHSPGETLNRLEKMLKAKNITILARINHAAGAEKAGLSLPATEVLIFGNPKLGTPLMQATRTMGIDLPLKVLAWKDDKGSWIAYNDPKWLAQRHGNTVDKVIETMSGVLKKLTDGAAAKN
ncbi:MAG: hypothetical protein CMM77_04425 [Rhodospirillaceae bacterium]|nr:hypothetical protein [Magnetovibrio sp.]MAY66354.1 hypothetical protein [Rhodospirillaceae bacterium]